MKLLNKFRYQIYFMTILQFATFLPPKALGVDSVQLGQGSSRTYMARPMPEPLDIPMRPSGQAVEEFVVKTESHILRLASFAYSLLTDSKFLEKFPEYQSLASKRDAVIQAILEHDASKIRTDDAFLERYNLPKGESALKYHFARFHGVNIQNLPPIQAAYFRAGINVLNRADSEHIRSVLAHLGFTALEQTLFLRFEEAIDKTDTYLSRKLEFGKIMVPPSMWVSIDPYDKRPIVKKLESIKLMRHLESRLELFAASTYGLDYTSYYVQRKANKDETFGQIKKWFRYENSTAAPNWSADFVSNQKPTSNRCDSVFMD